MRAGEVGGGPEVTEAGSAPVAVANHGRKDRVITGEAEGAEGRGRGNVGRGWDMHRGAGGQRRGQRGGGRGFKPWARGGGTPRGGVGRGARRGAR